ncbi:hypothetical protein WOLCODRAFT_153354 [Wolfiporia cocos MD-104 SS10]|uniref:Uncharacterized protein n=1 Tax=Wolfiporia cocos (strain MD-104) TaxID=742152 RepID=A0A2H3JTK8_WOLCO|nr:hypothetical protein WOLCODRAFT_153354 [Wolfiporia cocos MD-104 SS10]
MSSSGFSFPAVTPPRYEAYIDKSRAHTTRDGKRKARRSTPAPMYLSVCEAEQGRGRGRGRGRRTHRILLRTAPRRTAPLSRARNGTSGGRRRRRGRGLQRSVKREARSVKCEIARRGSRVLGSGWKTCPTAGAEGHGAAPRSAIQSRERGCGGCGCGCTLGRAGDVQMVAAGAIWLVGIAEEAGAGAPRSWLARRRPGAVQTERAWDAAVSITPVQRRASRASLQTGRVFVIGG